MKRFFYFRPLSLIVLFAVSAGFVGPVSAELEWTFRKQVPLASAPLDNAVSADGTITLYSLSGRNFSVFTYPEQNNQYHSHRE